MTRRRQLLCALELTALFIGLPLALTQARAAGWRLPVIPVLLLVTLGAWLALRQDPSFDRRRLTRIRAQRGEWPRILATFLVCAAALLLYTALFERELLFSFPRHRPLLWGAVVLLYPVLSAFPQELLYRAFFFYRYRELFPSWRLTALVSAAAFGYMHIIFGHPISVALTLVGGLFFARTYLRTQSALASAVEHSLYGCWVFTVGLGRYFYAGF